MGAPEARASKKSYSETYEASPKSSSSALPDALQDRRESEDVGDAADHSKSIKGSYVSEWKNIGSALRGTGGSIFAGSESGLI